MKKKSEIAFDKYISNYDLNEKQIRYKYLHSYEVEKLMKKLAKALKLSEEETKLAELIGLLHDIGRFEQVKKYGSCSDSKTGVDHADESCVYLFDKGHIRDFIEDDKYDDILKDAIKYHNKLEIDKSIKGKNLFFAKMIRDMDKVDIYRVLYTEYKGKFNKNEITKKVSDIFYSHKTMDIHILNSKTDEILSIIAFIYDINFKESFKILKESNYLEKYFQTIEVDKDSKDTFDKVKQEIKDYLADK